MNSGSDQRSTTNIRRRVKTSLFNTIRLKGTPMNRLTLIIVMLAVATTLFLNIAHSREIPDKIPAMANIGLGYGDYQIYNAYNGRDSWVTGTEVRLYGVVEKEVLDRYQHKVPEQWRKAVSKLGEVSVTHIGVPKTIYLHPHDGQKEAFGATWGLVPGLNIGLGFVRVGVSGGVIATYLYQRDAVLDESSHFIRPGLRGSANVSVPLFTKYLKLEAGILGDVYWPGKKIFGDKKVYRVGGNYVLLHLRVPFDVKAPKV
jgi:hypothetical protein